MGTFNVILLLGGVAISLAFGYYMGKSEGHADGYNEGYNNGRMDEKDAWEKHIRRHQHPDQMDI